MFDSLQDRLGQTLKAVAGQARLTEDNIKDTLREVRRALLEADVALPVVTDFVEAVKEKAVGEDVSQSLNPGQMFLKIVEGELRAAMGEANEELNLAAQPPAIILMAGLQGAGKTTSTGKLAKLLKERDKKKVMVVSADVYRPAAIKQLETLAQELDVHFCPSSADEKPVDIAHRALSEARKLFCDVLKANGFEVEPVADGELALNAARAFAPDLVIMDIQLPNISGLDLIVAFKKDASLVDTPVLAVTAYAGKGDEDRCVRSSRHAPKGQEQPLSTIKRNHS